MTWNAAITDSIIAALEPGKDYKLNDIRQAMRGKEITDVQLRNAVYGLHTSGRLLQSGTHMHYRFRINPAWAPRRSEVVREARGGYVPVVAEAAQSIAPAWPAPRHSFRTFGRPMVAAMEACPC